MNKLHKGKCRIYIWGVEGSPLSIHAVVKRAVGPGIFSRIRQVNVGYAPEGGRRVRVTISNRDKQSAKSALIRWSVTHKLNWRVDASGGRAPFLTPIAAIDPKRDNGIEHLGDTKLISWNIDGFISKELEITHLLEERQPDILGLQETKLSDLDRSPRFDGYVGHHGLGTNVGGKRGVSLLIRDDLTVQTTGVADTSNAIFRRVIHPTRCLVVGCIYVPCDQPSSKRSFLKRLGMTLATINRKFPTDAMVIFGDWNTTPRGVRQWVHEWQDRLPTCIICPNSAGGGGFALAYFPAGRGRQIEYRPRGDLGP